MDINKLKGRITEKQYFLRDFAKALGMTEPTLRKKMREDSFTIIEMEQIISMLELTQNEFLEIFFAYTQFKED